MSENEISVTIAATAKRAGLSTSAFYKRHQQRMTLEERRADNEEWIGALDDTIKTLTHRRASLVVTNVAIQQRITREAGDE